MFRISRYFSIASLLGFAIVIVALSYLYKQVSLESLKEQESRSNTALTQAFSNSIWHKYADYLKQNSGLEKAQIEALDRDVRRMMQGLNVAKVKLYNLNGVTLYSTEPEQIGSNKSLNKGFLTAKSGNIASELTFRNQFYALEGMVVDRNLIASYIPIVSPDTNDVEAVFELYSDVTPLIQKLGDSQTSLVGGVLVILSVLYLFLFVIVKRADNIIAKQDEVQRKHAEQVQHHAYHDALTLLPNRNMFSDRLHEAVNRSRRNNQPFALLFIDLDRFKLINDSLGHITGDQLLCVASKRIMQAMRDIDTVYRMGGDEFTVITDALHNEQEAAIIAQRIIDAMSQPILLDDHEVIVTTSIGIAMYPKDDITADKLVKDADAAMYKAKELGRNCYQYYTEDMNARSLERLAMERDLRKAISNEEFVLYYQPKAASTNGEIIGMEALLRWNHPEKGLLTPDHFLSYLEDTGLIIPVGEWVIRTACQEAKRWIHEGYTPMRISVNLSSAQFRADNLVNRVEQILNDFQLDPQYLELELTESLLIDNPENAIKVLEAIKSLGIILSIDDFGTGYSSLNYLKTLPIDYIKIDRSFIQDLETNTKDAAITVAIATLAHNLKMQVVAEGVENQHQVNFLKQQGCQQLQGFLIGKPMPISELKTLVDSNSPDIQNHKIATR